MDGTHLFFGLLFCYKNTNNNNRVSQPLLHTVPGMVVENKKPTGGIEPPTFRLQSECSTTKLSRRASDIWRAGRVIYRNPPIAQLAERETVDG